MGSNSLPYVFNTQLERLKDAQSVEQKARARAYLGESFGLNDLPGPALPAELTDYFLASDMARFVLGAQDAPHVRSYYERPRLAFFRHGFVVRDWAKSAPRFTEGIDLINAPYQFAGNPEEALRLGMETGIVDTALERLTVRPNRSFNTVPLFAAALAQGVSILTLTSEQAAALADLALPPAIKNVLAGELAQGKTLILPAHLVKLSNVETYGWWSVDPTSGVVLGKMELGGAQALIEYNEMNEKMEKWEEIFTKFYGGILRCYMQALGQNLGLVDEGPFGIPLPGHLGEHGGPGEDPAPGMDQLAECIISRACEAIADITVMCAVEPGLGYVGDTEINTIKSIRQVIWDWSRDTAVAKGSSYALGKACEGAAAKGGGE
jgi:hypothetical protein